MRLRPSTYAILAPFVVLAVALIAVTILNLAGAECTSVGNNPMHLDNTETCNDLGELQTTVGWAGLLVVLALLPVAAVGLIAAIGGAVRRRSSSPEPRPLRSNE